ncbi:type IV secretory system conjugative DNA transfer family protein [Arthrobacter sp. A2-55]|uniref:type IV secretory system conjugative DNA transfer family protein n=1 Tax=Arthrobacter sp. A2-55 TaxID=2897337 RepID=UPI0021CD5FFA|nr:type IV secretory system conjugative DNA transfer family protein [Arthrobacter sp. A2-55]MCU6481920.1 type IV secretory system conjugative DNA transfer family protein [Arthrobacter sp. A2-55]
MEQRIFRLARAGGIETNPTTFTQRAGTFASAVANTGPATLLTRREKTGLNGYLILDEKAVGSNAALHLAQTVGARAEAAELPDDLGATPVVGQLTYHPSPALRETQAGIDPTELPRLLATAMPEGSWVSVTMRKPTTRERKHYTPWLAHRLGTAVPTHHSTSPNAVVVSMIAGGASRAEVDSLLLQVTAGLPGFDLDSRVHFPGRFHRALLGLPAGLLLALATLIGAPHLDPAILAQLTPAIPYALGTAAMMAAAGVAAATNLVKSPDRKLRARLAVSEFPHPASRHGPPKPPHREKVVKGHTKGADGDRIPFERFIPAFDGDYPLAHDAFMVGPNVIVGMVSPHAGAISGVAGTKARSTPPVMLQPIGPFLGTNDDGNAFLSADDLRMGTAIVGRAGSGKSLLVRSLFGWHCLERVQPCGRPGYPGTRNTLIAFESKGDGVPKYVQWAHTMGDKILVIDVADKTTPAIDLFAVPGSISAKANFFTNAMRYAFGDQAIGDRSYETLVSVLTGALAVTEDVLAFMEDRNERLIPAGQSPIFYAHLLLGGHSDAVGVELWNGIQGLAKRLRERDTPNEDLDLATVALASLFEGRTESARRSFLEAPRNKISQLLALEDWWSPARRKITWAQVLEGHRSIVVNTGSSSSGIILDESQNQQISSLLMYGLQNAIMRHCPGWLEEGRSVTIFADELALLAGTSPEVVAWIRDQGRSYGIRAILATQRPEQLGATLRNNFLTYSTLLSFAQTDVNTAVEVAANVGSGGDWSAEDIQHLEPYHVVVRSHVAQRRQPGFIVKLPNFEKDMATYPAAQGYPTPAAHPTMGASL